MTFIAELYISHYSYMDEIWVCLFDPLLTRFQSEFYCSSPTNTGNRFPPKKTLFALEIRQAQVTLYALWPTCDWLNVSNFRCSSSFNSNPISTEFGFVVSINFAHNTTWALTLYLWCLFSVKLLNFHWSIWTNAALVCLFRRFLARLQSGLYCCSPSNSGHKIGYILQLGLLDLN